MVQCSPKAFSVILCESVISVLTNHYTLNGLNLCLPALSQLQRPDRSLGGLSCSLHSGFQKAEIKESPGSLGRIHSSCGGYPFLLEISLQPLQGDPWISKLAVFYQILPALAMPVNSTSAKSLPTSSSSGLKRLSSFGAPVITLVALEEARIISLS